MEKKIVGGLKDEKGNDVQILYRVRLMYIVSAIAPCSRMELAEIVNGRIEAGGGVVPSDIDGVRIVDVERM